MKLLPYAFIALTATLSVLGQQKGHVLTKEQEEKLKRGETVILPDQPNPTPRPKPIDTGATPPPLQVQEWVKGAPVTSFEKGKVYLVEFWAVWCGPCIGNIPHLNALQRKYAKDGLTVIGFTSPDRTPDKPDKKEGNGIELVREFVAQRGDRMSYTIAYDMPARETFKAYFNAEQAGIPQAFIIGRDGKVVASGHPFYLEEVIADVMSNRWDPVEGPARFAELRKKIRAPDGAKDYAQFKAARADLAAFSEVYYHRTIYTELLRAIEEGDAAEVRRVGDSMIKHALQTGEASDFGYTLNQMLKRDPMKTKAKPYLDLAGRISEAYVTVTEGLDSSALGMRGEWYANMGDLQSAIAFMRRAMDAEPEGRNKQYKDRLAELEKLAATKTS